MVKDFDYVLDLGKLMESTSGLKAILDECTTGRAPPLTPDDFRDVLSKKSFTSKKADEDMVAKLYEATFKERFAKAEELNYANLSWGDAEVETFAKVIASGALDNLKVSWRPTALSSCLETWHAHSPDSEHLFDVPCADTFAQREQHWRCRPHRSRQGG